jgi:hypothetical protein
MFFIPGPVGKKCGAVPEDFFTEKPGGTFVGIDRLVVDRVDQEDGGRVFFDQCFDSGVK